jgi:phosphatidate cytidylyltransferase
MLSSRLLVAAILLPLGLAAIYTGGWIYFSVIILILALAAWEYVHLFRACGQQPAGALVIGGTILIALGRALDQFESAGWILALLIMAIMAYHLWAYERGRDQAATDFTISLAGSFYIGWLGAYLISLRQLPGGFWWIMLVLPIVWLADVAAYFVGSTLGKRRLSPRLSPKKTWEGYLAGVFFGTLGGALLALLWSQLADIPLAFTPLEGALLGLLISGLTTLGDLGESMIKRHCGVKDSGNLLPGHGGIFDRIDSWLWTAAIGYYVIVWLLV